MSQYRSTGGLDDAIASDGDKAFNSVNLRDQLNQLLLTEVRESVNGRMEGYWKPRKSVESRTGALVSGGNPLQLPFLLVGTSVVITNATVTSGVVTLTTASNHGLTAGATLNIQGIIYTAGSDPNGVFTATTAATNSITYPLAGGVTSYTFSAASQVITSTSRAITAVTVPTTGTIRITVTGHGYSAGTTGMATISGLDAAVNGNFQLTYFDANRLDYTVAGITSVTDVNGTLSQTLVNDAAAGNVRASCLFSNPNEQSKEYVIVALDTVAKKIDLDTYAVTTITYPPAQTVDAFTDMIQVFDKVMLFRDGKQALEWYPNGRPIVSASSNATATPNTVVTMNVREHGLLVGSPLIIAGLTGGTPPNGTYVVATVTSQDTFTFIASDISINTTFVTTVATVSDGFTLSPGGAYTQPQVFDSHGGRVSVDGGLVTITVDGNTTLNAGNSIIVYENTIPELSSLVGKEFQVASATTTQIQFYAPVPNIILRDITEATHTTNIVKLFTDTNHGIPVGDIINVNAVIYASGTNPNGLFTTIRQATNIGSASFLGTTVTINCTEHGFSTNNLITIDGIEFTSGTNPNGVFSITKINAHSFSYILVGGVDSYITTSAFATIDDINKRLIYNLVGASGLYTVTSSYVTTATGASNQQIEIGGRFSAGGGFMHQPGAPWGIHFQRRLWVPYYYDQSGAYNSPTYVSRKIADEIAVSDILDTTTFDQIESQFRISGGTADSVVAMHGFYNDSLVVLNRNSLHLIQESKGGLLDVTVKELTSEIGCLARKSVVMRGNAMYFLSDNGVYGLEFLNDYNLRGMDQPLSKNIQPYIDRINPDKADKAVAVYFDNRYFLAVPLDSVAGANDAIGNNAVLVYNFLNKGWESIDTYGNNQFIITDYITASGGVRNNLYTVTSNGGLHQMEFAESIQDRLSVSNLDGTIVTPQIAASLTSRGYNFNTLERKRFTDTQIQMQNLAGETGEYSISFAAEDPDFAAAIGTTSTFLGGMLTPSTTNEAETATIRCRIGGVRGFTGTLILNRTQGSPKIHSIMVAGSVTNRQIISQK